jgi:choline dehydrogenase
VGVWYVRHGKLKYVKAAKEIIVSTGSVDSPKLLMLSGIGPKEHLEDVSVSFIQS